MSSLIVFNNRYESLDSLDNVLKYFIKNTDCYGTKKIFYYMVETVF